MPEELERLAQEIRNLERDMEALYKKEGSLAAPTLLKLSERIDSLVARHLALQVAVSGQ